MPLQEPHVAPALQVSVATSGAPCQPALRKPRAPPECLHRPRSLGALFFSGSSALPPCSGSLVLLWEPRSASALREPRLP